MDNCKIAIKLDENFFDGHKNLGNILSKLGKFDEPSKSYERALKIQPGDKIVLHLVSSLYGKTPKTAPDEYNQKNIIMSLIYHFKIQNSRNSHKKLKYKI